MKINYTILEYKIEKSVGIIKSNLIERDLVICTTTFIIPLGSDKDKIKFLRGKLYRVNKIYLNSNSVPGKINKHSKTDYFQIKDDLGFRAKIKFEKNKFFRKAII